MALAIQAWPSSKTSFKSFSHVSLFKMETTVQVKTEPLDIPEDRGQPCVDTEGEEGEIEETGVDDGLPHQEAMARVNSTIAELIEVSLTYMV